MTTLSVFAITLALTGPASHEIVLTDEGFRRAEDCSETMVLRQWRDGHYWSARPAWDCVDPDYLSKWEGYFESDPPPYASGERVSGPSGWVPDSAGYTRPAYQGAHYTGHSGADWWESSTVYVLRDDPTPKAPPIPVPAPLVLLLSTLMALIGVRLFRGRT